MPNQENLFFRSSAVFSPCRTWRYRLDRDVQPSGQVFLFAGVNGSTADEFREDHTTMKWRGFSLRNGARRYIAVNPFAFTATDVRELGLASDPVGPENDRHIHEAIAEPGQTIRWTNRDGGNAHSATAYHPANYGRSRRIPRAASAWDSDLLLPGESFSVTLTEPGVYDYYCIPHEHAGMVGRIVIGGPVTGGWTEGDPRGDLPEIALRSFPPVEQIMAERVVRRG